ncbi:MAG TPA: hypothetical protein ENJ97_02890, partial [Planctomycetes bacterium]|nr:hypothetical protein [Planctomycetota bacterium]
LRPDRGRPLGRGGGDRGPCGPPGGQGRGGKGRRSGCVKGGPGPAFRSREIREPSGLTSPGREPDEIRVRQLS